MRDAIVLLEYLRDAVLSNHAEALSRIREILPRLEREDDNSKPKQAGPLP